MRTLSFIAVGLCTIANLSSFGQGVVQFQNRDLAAGIDAPIYFMFPNTRIDGADPLFRVALLGGPKGAPFGIPGLALGQLTMLASPTTGATWVGFGTGADAGYFDVGNDTARVIPGVDWGQEATLEVVAWHGNYTTWEEAFTATKSDPSLHVGFSGPIFVRLPSVPSDGVKLYGLRSFDFVIPEPSAFSLLVVFGVVYRAHKRRRLM